MEATSAHKGPGPTQPSIPQADPAPFRPADPAATEPVTEVSLLSSRTQTHFPRAPASWLSSGISRTAGGGGFKFRSWLVPTGPVAVHSDPTLLLGHALPTPGPQSSGDQPYLLHSLGPSALLPLAPHARSHPGLLGGARAGSRRGKKDLKRGGSGSGPTCISVPAVSSGGGGGSPTPCPPSATISQPRSAQAPGPLFSSPKEAIIEKSGEREGNLHTHFRHPLTPTPGNPEDLTGCQYGRDR